jgi:hypothetical protein
MSDGITFEQWKYIFWSVVEDRGMQLFVKDDNDLREFYDDDLSPEDAINVIKVLCTKMS